MMNVIRGLKMEDKFDKMYREAPTPEAKKGGGDE